MWGFSALIFPLQEITLHRIHRFDPPQTRIFSSYQPKELVFKTRSYPKRVCLTKKTYIRPQPIPVLPGLINIITQGFRFVGPLHLTLDLWTFFHSFFSTSSRESEGHFYLVSLENPTIKIIIIDSKHSSRLRMGFFSLFSSRSDFPSSPLHCCWFN